MHNTSFPASTCTCTWLSIFTLYKKVLNGVHKQFEVFSSHIREDFLFYETILRTLAKIVPNSDPVFRDECELEQ